MNKIFRHENIKTWILFAVTLLVGLISYNYLPERIPVHFDAAGNIDRYGGRISIFLAPAVIAAITLLAEFVRNVDPKRNAYNKFNKQYYMIFFAVSLLMFMIQLYTIAVSMNVKILNISIIMPVAVGMLFTVIGNSMPKFKQNFYAGIRTSWTLSDEEIWFKTHRFGGKLWFVGGILMMATAVLPKNMNFIVFTFLALVLALIPVIYSYVIYRNKYK